MPPPALLVMLLLLSLTLSLPLGLLLAPLQAEAASIKQTDNAIAFTTGASCPTDWIDVSSSFPGRVVVPPASNANVNQKVNSPATTDAGPLHSHGLGGANVIFSTGDQVLVRDNQYKDAATTDTWSISGNIFGGDGLAYVVLRVCMYGGTTPLNVGKDLLIFTLSSSCPTSTGFAAYTSNAGRMWAIASSSVTSTPVDNGVASVADLAQFDGTHAHNIAASSVSTVSTNAFSCCASAAWSSSSNFVVFSTGYTLVGATSSANVGVPYVHLAACVATSPTPAPIYLPHPSMVFYSSANSCPSLYVDATTMPGPVSYTHLTLPTIA